MPINKYNDISPRTAGFATADLLERGQHLLVTERFGHTDAQGQNKTKTRKWRRYLSFPRATAPMAEGITPAGQQINYEDVEANLDQYGDWVPLTDVIADTHEDPVLKEMMGITGEQAAETIECVRVDVLKGGSNAYYANGVASRSLVTSPATRNDLRKVFRDFQKNKAKMITRIIGATAKVSTEPVSAGFFAMGHTDLLADLKNISGWTPVAQYSDHMKALPGEVGAVEEIRFILTPLFEPWSAAGVAGTTYLSGGAKVSGSTACDVYPLIIVGRDAYAIVPLAGKNAVEIGVQNPGKKTDSDPLGQRGFVSWKTWQAAAILNNLWIARLEVAATAL